MQLSTAGKIAYTQLTTHLHYNPSLHDALPISRVVPGTTRAGQVAGSGQGASPRVMLATSARVRPSSRVRIWRPASAQTDRKSTRLNSSHPSISYAVFCLKKKKYNDALIASSSV